MDVERAGLLGQTALEWCERKRIGSVDQFRNSDQARRYDLIRIAAFLHGVTGQQAPVVRGPDVEAAFGDLRTDVLGTENVLSLLAAVVASGASVSSNRRMLSTLRGLCRFLHRQGVLDHDPTEDDLVRLPADPGAGTDEPPHFAADDVAALLAAAANPLDGVRTSWPARDVAVLGVAAFCGARATEIAELRVADVDTRRRRISFRYGTKGARPRVVPAPARLLETLGEYHTERQVRWRVGSTGDPLFVREVSGRPMPVDRNWIARLVTRCARQAGVPVPPDAVVHALRHSFGVELAYRNVPVPVIQQLLGHRDPRTTSVYTRMSDDYLDRALDDAGWLEGDG